MLFALAVLFIPSIWRIETRLEEVRDLLKKRLPDD
jgi:hypothetical protein